MKQDFTLGWESLEKKKSLNMTGELAFKDKKKKKERKGINLVDGERKAI